MVKKDIWSLYQVVIFGIKNHLMIPNFRTMQHCKLLCKKMFMPVFKILNKSVCALCDCFHMRNSEYQSFFCNKIIKTNINRFSSQPACHPHTLILQKKNVFRQKEADQGIIYLLPTPEASAPWFYQPNKVLPHHS